MTYSKPEVAVLGEAAVLIQTKRSGSFEPSNPTLQQIVADCEFDD